MFHPKINMLKASHILLALVLLFGLSLKGQTAFASESQSNVEALISVQKFDEALDLMSQEDVATQNSYDHRFLKGRILSWNGSYKQARNVLNALMSDYPGNDDVLLASGSLDYYQGNLDAAENAFTSILSRTPDRSDALSALENVQKAKRANRPHKWRIDGGVGQSSFDESNLEDWNSQYLRAEYTPKDVSYHASANRYKRFGETNIEFKGGIASAKRGDWDWAAEVGVTPDALFRPKTSFGGRVGRKVELENGPTLVATMHYRHDKYTEAKIHNISPEVTAYFKNGARLTGRLIGTVQSEEDDQVGWLVNGSYPVADKWKLNAGIAQAPEAVNGLVVNTKSLFGGVSYEVSPNLDLHVNIARDNRENTYIRNAVNVGFTHKY